MSRYTANRLSNRFNPHSQEPYRLSRSRIETFLECPRCFYMDRRLGVDRPPGFPFNLNNAVDILLKKEFDLYREKEAPHPLMTEYQIDAIPFKHEKMDEWRDALRGGVVFLHPRTNLLITGGVDDIWVDSNNVLYVVDYKATSKPTELTDRVIYASYKRQMEFYQWLLRHNGFNVSDTGYFVYCNGDQNAELFESVLHFDIKIFSVKGNSDWVEGAIVDAHSCLIKDDIPDRGRYCDYCTYRESSKRFDL